MLIKNKAWQALPKVERYMLLYRAYVATQKRNNK